MGQIARFFSHRRRMAAVVVGLIVVIGAGIGAVVLTSPGRTERPFVKASRNAPSPAPVTTTSTIAAPTVPAVDPGPSPSAPPLELTDQRPGSPPPSAVAAEVIIVCDSPVIDENGYETSSSYAYRAPAGTQPPPGCHLG